MTLKNYTANAVALGMWLACMLVNVFPLFVNPWTFSLWPVFMVPLSALVIILLVLRMDWGYSGKAEIYRTVPQSATD